MKRLIAAVAALGVVALASPHAAAQPQRAFSATYTVSAKGIPAGDFNYSLNIDGDGYRAKADRRMTGFVRTLAGASQDYRYEVRGRATADGGLEPVAYEHQGGKKNRLVKVAFEQGRPTTTATPSMGMGDPPATETQKAGSIDQVTAIAQMVTASGDPCNRTLRVLLDGRARFDFVMRPAGTQRVSTAAFKGDALKCTVQFRPIAGFSDPQDPATLTFLFARTPSGLFAPVRIEMPTNDVGVAVLEARRFSAS